MRLLVVEGNKRDTWVRRELSGGIAYHKRFRTMLEYLQPGCQVEFAFPADDFASLPSIHELQSYHGVLWTGSSLHVNHPVSAVQQQLMFAERVFESRVPFYGSCWGLQVAVVVAGGKVGPCEKGREIGISEPIVLTDSGCEHPYFSGRKHQFKALCLHLDEIVELPSNSNVLAKNSHSEIQALTIRYKGSEFFGVQYHPEFKVSDLVFITKQMMPSLVEEGRFPSETSVDEFISTLLDHNNVPEEVSNYMAHIQEIKNWLHHAVLDEKKDKNNSFDDSNLQIKMNPNGNNKTLINEKSHSRKITKGY